LSVEVVDFMLENARDYALAEQVDFFALQSVEPYSKLRWSFDQTEFIIV
jgi:hypothetical protein